VGGDSGAWVIDNDQGRVCGHVLAWCQRNSIAYICPMEILLEDIKKTLGAKRVSLPGDDGEEEVILGISSSQNGHLIDQKSATSADMELPDIARLDFGDRERLGLGEGRGADLLRSNSKIAQARLGSRMEYPRFIGAQSTRQLA
jgi:hypothetical protein